MHMVLASLIGVAFLLMGVAAWRLLQSPQESASRLMLSGALALSLFALPLQMVTGDLHGENTLRYQPAKLAAIEGAWHPPGNGEGEPLRLFAIPDQQLQSNHFEVSIPDIGSLYLRHNLTGHIKSLSEFPRDQLPPVAPVFIAFRLMVGLSLVMLMTSFVVGLQRWRGKLWHARRMLRVLVWMSPAGFVALLAGWMVTEIGRQPWTVYGMLRTSDSVSPLSLSTTLVIFLLVVMTYGLGFSLGLRYLLRQVASPLPQDDETVVLVLKTPN